MVGVAASAASRRDGACRPGAPGDARRDVGGRNPAVGRCRARVGVLPRRRRLPGCAQVTPPARTWWPVASGIIPGALSGLVWRTAQLMLGVWFCDAWYACVLLAGPCGSMLGPVALKVVQKVDGAVNRCHAKVAAAILRSNYLAWARSSTAATDDDIANVSKAAGVDTDAGTTMTADSACRIHAAAEAVAEDAMEKGRCHLV